MSALKNIRVIELAGLGAAPFTGMLLGDMGADVLVIDRPSGGRAPDKFEIMRRNKRSRKLDLKDAKDLATVRELVAGADVLIEGYRPGVMERLGLGPNEMTQLNPRLVYARVTGWGQDGPLAHLAGHDINYIALTGTLHAIGDRSGVPVPPLSLVGDFGGGGLFAAFGIVSALLERVSSGLGQVVDAAMFDGAAVLMAAFYGMRQRGTWSLERSANQTDGGSPFYRTYQTADDKYVAVGPLEEKFYEEFLRVLGLKEKLGHLTRGKENWPALESRIGPAFRAGTQAHWCEAFRGIDACVTPVLNMDDAWTHEHAAARQTFLVIDGVTHPAPGPRLSRTPPSVRLTPTDQTTARTPS